MLVSIREYRKCDVPEMIKIWNDVVTDGIAFPQEELLNQETAISFFSEQSYTAIAEDIKSSQVIGLYILHPNNIGRCSHICNASYAVKKESRGQHVGEKLVLDCLEKGKSLGFKILQFNAVVASNIHARHLYERLGFIQLGTIPKGFRLKNGKFEDICPYYHML